MSKKEKKRDNHQTNMAADTKQMDAAADYNGRGRGHAEPGQEAAQIEELTADLQRVQAEFQNYKRRESENRADLMVLAKQEIVAQLLPMLDNIDRALSHRPEELKGNAWADGVAQVAKQVTETLKRLGVERITSVGQPFDHNLHEAIGYDEGEGDREVVSEELQPGYRMGDRVVRPAMVKVKRK